MQSVGEVAAPVGTAPPVAGASTPRRLAGVAQRAIEAALAFVLAADVAVVFFGIVARYVFNNPIVWVEEVARLLLVTLTFVGGAVALYRGEHIRVTAFRDRLPPPAAAATRCAGLGVIAGFSAILAWHSVGFIGSRTQVSTLTSGIPPVAFAWPVLIGSVLAVLYAWVLAWHEPRRPLLMGLGSLVVLVVLLSIARPAWQPVIQSLGTVGPVFALLFIAVLAGVPVTYALGLSTVAGVWLDGRVGLAALPNRVEAGADQFVLLAIPFFVLAGTLMESGGISVRLVDFVRVLLGHVRGGLGIVMIGSMYLFSGVSGSKAADMAAVGSVLIPTMKRRDYDEGEGVAILAASAVMGETIPPSIAILVLASVTSLSVSALFIGGVIPAIALGLILAAAVYVRAGRLGGVRDPRPTAGQALRSFGGALLPLGMPVIIFGGILLGVATPTEVSSFAVLFGLLVSVLVYREMGLARVMAILVEAASVGGMIMFIASTGSALSWVLTLQGVPQRIATWMTDAHVGAVGFLVMTIVLMAFMGAVLEGVPALLVFAPMLLPAATELGVHPLHFGIVLIIAMGIGLFAPPVGAGLYIAAAIGRVLPERAMRPMLVYLTVLTLGVVLVAAVPELTLWLPRTVGALK